MDQEDSNGKLRFGAKSDFVRSIDRSVPAAEVVALAELRGIKLTTGFVYNIRSSGSGRESAPRQGRLSKPKPDASPEAQLRIAIAQIGLVRARQILDEVEATFAGG